MNGPVQFAIEFDKHGTAKPLAEEDAARAVEDKRLAWVHLDATHPDARKWITENVTYLDSLITDALLADETRPRFTQVGEGVLMIMRGVNLNENAEPEDMVSVRLWADPHRIISICKRPLMSITDLRNMLENGQSAFNTGSFLAQLSLKLLQRMQPVISELNDEADAIEETLLDTAETGLRERIVSIRRRAIVFRRYLVPQRDALQRLRNSEIPWLSVSDIRHLQEAYDSIMRYLEDLDTIRERAQIVHDELVNILSDRLNKNLYTLSVIAAVFLPLGFLTGLLGINVGGLPGQDSPYAFWYFSGFLVALVAAQVWIFRKLKWF